MAHAVRKTPTLYRAVDISEVKTVPCPSCNERHPLFVNRSLVGPDTWQIRHVIICSTYIATKVYVPQEYESRECLVPRLKQAV